MKNIFKIAIRNLLRYKRRTLLTSLLITIGVVMVIVFSGVSGSFKNMMIGTITDSMMGHLQIHKKGYMSSIDNLPLDINITGNGLNKLKGILDKNDQIEAYTYRIKFSAMISNYVQTSGIRLNAVYPEMENKTCPELASRIEGNFSDKNKFIQPGEIIVPENLAKGLSLKIGDTVVLVANNKDGSVNGLNFKVGGILKGLMGPGGRDGYIHLDDAKTLLRIEDTEISEVAIRLKNFNQLDNIYEELSSQLPGAMGKKVAQPQLSPDAQMAKKRQGFEVHTWAQLSPFSTIAKITDLLIMTVTIILISIVLVSILNVMLMSVYERINEIGTIAAIGTQPSRILALFLVEGFSLGVFSALFGDIIGLGILSILRVTKVHFTFGRMADLMLTPTISPSKVIFVSIIVIIISVIASLQPAVKASKLEPVDALRHV